MFDVVDKHNIYNNWRVFPASDPKQIRSRSTDVGETPYIASRSTPWNYIAIMLRLTASTPSKLRRIFLPDTPRSKLIRLFIDSYHSGKDKASFFLNGLARPPRTPLVRVGTQLSNTFCRLGPTINRLGSRSWENAVKARRMGETRRDGLRRYQRAHNRRRWGAYARLET